MKIANHFLDLRMGPIYQKSIHFDLSLFSVFRFGW